jgi:hypothetical protein
MRLAYFYRNWFGIFLVLCGLLIFIVIGLGFIYPGLVDSTMMIILLLILGLSAFVIGKERQGE